MDAGINFCSRRGGGGGGGGQAQKSPPPHIEGKAAHREKT